MEITQPPTLTCYQGISIKVKERKLCIYNYLDTIESWKKFWGLSNICDVFMTWSMSDFYVILQILATVSVLKCVETLDFHMEYVLW